MYSKIFKFFLNFPKIRYYEISDHSSISEAPKGEGFLYVDIVLNFKEDLTYADLIMVGDLLFAGPSRG